MVLPIQSQPLLDRQNFGYALDEQNLVKAKLPVCGKTEFTQEFGKSWSRFQRLYFTPGLWIVPDRVNLMGTRASQSIAVGRE